MAGPVQSGQSGLVVAAGLPKLGCTGAQSHSRALNHDQMAFTHTPLSSTAKTTRSHPKNKQMRHSATTAATLASPATPPTHGPTTHMHGKGGGGGIHKHVTAKCKCGFAQPLKDVALHRLHDVSLDFQFSDSDVTKSGSSIHQNIPRGVTTAPETTPDLPPAPISLQSVGLRSVEVMKCAACAMV